MKKIFISSVVILVIILIFLGVYNFAFKKDKLKSKDSQINTEVQIDNTLFNNKEATEKIVSVSKQGVIGPVINKKSETILYFSFQDGFTWQTNLEGKADKQITTTKIPGLTDVIWSPNQDKILMKVNNAGTNVFFEYDVITQKIVTLKSNVDNVAWDNLGSKIFYKYFDEASKSRSLNISNPDGSGWAKLAEITARNLSIKQIPLTSIVSFWNSPSAKEETQLQTIGITGADQKVIFSGKFGADYLWAPNGIMALVSSLVEQNSKKITLGLVMMDGSYKDLNIPTLVSKCVWSSDNKTVYYALAGDIPDDSVMPDDYQAGKFNTKDTFWKVDTATGKKDRIVDPTESEGNYDSSNMFLSPTEDALYFINKIDKKLYRISL